MDHSTPPTTSRPRRRRRWFGAAATAAAALLLPFLSTPLPVHAVSQTDIPPQEPGVTMRVYDVQVALFDYCVLKPGQTPNIDKVMPTIDWTTTADFGFANQFVTEVSGNLNITTAGTHDFRLISDDGARFFLDGTQVIDHPGRHGATPKDGSIDLTAGYHALRIEHFDAQSTKRLRLEWRPPGATGYTLVPTSVLSTDSEVVRVTSPGRKQCEGVTDAPGDGLPLTGVHPAYTLTNLRPDGFQPQVTGMDWLPDGRLAISTWGGDRVTVLGEVYLLDGVTGNTDPSKVTIKKIAQGLQEPMGLKYVDGTIYVSEKHQLTALVDKTGDEVTDEYRRIATWPFSGNYHEFAFGLLYKGGYFYVTTGISMVPGGATANPQPVPHRGSTLKINKKTGEVTYIASGLRTPNGIGWGPGNDIFVTDNQGMWVPASKLVRIKEGAFYNHYVNPSGTYDDQPVTEPVLWLPHNEISNSPSNPIVLPDGVFKGQMVFGDVTYGGLQRAYLEKVAGEYQGAVFRMTQGLESGVSRIGLGPDNAIYTGGIGWAGNWGQAGKLSYGLQKLSLNGAEAFDIRKMRAVKGGFELEYTQPLSDETAQNLAAKYKVKQWRYVATPQYGGPKIGEQTLEVTSATLSKDRKKVTLKITGLKPGHVVHVHSPRPFDSASGQELWSTEAWYTLNRLADGTTAPAEYEAESAKLAGGTGWNTNHAGYSGAGFVDRNWEPGASTTFAVRADKAGRHDIELRYANGPNSIPTNPPSKSMSLYVNGKKEKQIWLAPTGAWANWATQTETVTLRPGANTIAYVYEATDFGRVNLDKITVTPSKKRITLFDGTNLDAWETTSGAPATWPVADGTMESLGGDIRTKERFGDFRMHVEWYQPHYPPEVTGQARGNSGVYIFESYELQVLESYGRPPELNGAGSLYLKKAPDVNAARPTGEWQTYDIEFRAARFDNAAKKVEDARITVKWNGQLVHDNVAINGPTGAGRAEDPAPGKIKLQDHGDPGDNPRFRNVWIERL
ncbi:family 16 glycoside hydrolase [Streptosporangium sp. NPDC049046]|uniref:family 16 glycoside hydrolase n=1 Tax=unclassified Streptosporangium TaxID=2632669 RepID=UPI00344AA0E2